MSSIALVWAANVKGLKPHSKIVLIQLADFHNKETHLCFPSAKRLAAECEMDRSTVFRHLERLETAGLISRHARGADGGGRSSNQYELHIDITFGPSAEQRSQKATGAKVAETDSKGRAPAPTLVAQSDCNLVREPGLTLFPPITPTDILAELVGLEMAEEFVAHRQDMKKPLSERGAKAMVKTLADCSDPASQMNLSIANGYQGVFLPKQNGHQNGRQPTTSQIAAAGDRIAAGFR